MNKKCNGCGSEVPETARFCQSCGGSDFTVIDENQTVVLDENELVYEQYKHQSETVSAPRAVSFLEAIKLFFVNYVNFTGRSTRSEYWWAFLFNVIVTALTSQIPFIGAIVAFGLLIPGIAITVRRLHDIGKSWLNLLFILIPFAGSIVLLVFYCIKSDGDNKWGPAPRS